MELRLRQRERAHGSSISDASVQKLLIAGACRVPMLWRAHERNPWPAMGGRPGVPTAVGREQELRLRHPPRYPLIHRRISSGSNDGRALETRLRAAVAPPNAASVEDAPRRSQRALERVTPYGVPTPSTFGTAGSARACSVHHQGVKRRARIRLTFARQKYPPGETVRARSTP